MPDEGHRLTDERLAALERRIGRVYGQAAKEVQGEVDAYFRAFARRDAEQKRRLDAGEITAQQYQQWRLAQMGRGERFAALRDKLAERMTRANEVAAAYVNDATPGIYSLNRNYAAYTIEQVAGDVGFTLWDEQTVRRLLADQPDLMPYYPPARAVRRGIDLAWGKKQITAQVTSGILMGEGIGKLADRLQRHIPEMNRTSAIRAARTAVTGAECAGRQDTYLAAEKMGLGLKKRWLATLDNRTRHAHALLDGQTVAPGKPFKVDGYELMFPGDKSAPAYLVYNCRCTVVADLDGVDTSDAKRWAVDPETGERVLIQDMTYSEWAGWKESVANGVKGDIIKSKPSVHEEYYRNKEKIDKILHDVEEKRRTLDHEAGMVIDRFGTILEETSGEAHGVLISCDMKDTVFTHNHPSGGCFSPQDLYSAIKSNLLELRASTPQGIYYSLFRTKDTVPDVTFADEYKSATSITKATEAVRQDLISGKITKKEIERREFGLYVDYMSKMGEEYLKNNAERFGYVYTKGRI